MAISLTHTTVAVGTDAGNGEIRKAQWNEAHTLTSATNVLLGRLTAGSGAVEEITFEEGSWTPTIIGVTTGGTGTYTSQVGRYSRIGQRVFYSCAVSWTAHTGTGFMRVSGLPYACSNTANNFYFASIGASLLTFTGQLCAAPEVGTSQISIFTFASGGAIGALTMDTAASVWISGHYDV